MVCWLMESESRLVPEPRVKVSSWASTRSRMGRAISTVSVHWKSVVQLLIYQFYWKPWERHFGVCASGWEMEDLYAYTMCKHTFVIQLQVRAGQSGVSTDSWEVRITACGEGALFARSTGDALFHDSVLPVMSCFDQAPGNGTRKLNSIDGLQTSVWLSCF